MKCAAFAFLLFPTASWAQDNPGKNMPIYENARLIIAIEAAEFTLSLQVPRAEIMAGQDASADENTRDLVASAISELSKPMNLFAPPAAADCMTATANVSQVGGGFGSIKHGKTIAAGAYSSETRIQARYLIQCKSIDALDLISFPYFERFENSQSLTVHLTSTNGARVVEVERATPVLNLTHSR